MSRVFLFLLNDLWEWACPRRRLGSQPISCRCGVHIRCCGHGDLWFRLTATHFFYKRLKKVSKKTLRPERPAPRRGSGFPRSGIPQGASPSGRLRSTSMRCPRLCRGALRAIPLMNACARPAEGAGGSRARARSRAAGELTLGLLSGGAGVRWFVFFGGVAVLRLYVKAA
ncbi:hypothetical protein D3C85_827920 [compost metagenome]